MPTIVNCTGCPYRALGPAIGTRGDMASAIVLVGEAPGAGEIAAGRPFVGRAGSVLWAAVAEAGLSEGAVFITNAVSCRPSPVHPTVEAIHACRARLVTDLEAHPRSAIVALGGTAVRAITGRRDFRVMRDRGTPLASAWGPVVPTLHPARVLRRQNERPLLVSDLQAARRLAMKD